METRPEWIATKYVYVGQRLRANCDSRYLSSGSRLAADLVAQLYGRHIPCCVKGALVDLGCGHAPLMGSYAPYVDSALLVDWANSFHDNPLLDVVTDLNAPLPLASMSCDTVIMSDVLEHVRYPEQLLEETYRILKPGGCLIMNTPFMYGLHEEPYDYCRYTKYNIDAMLCKYGFRVRLLSEYGGGFEVIADILGKIMANIPYFGNPIAKLLFPCITILSMMLPSRLRQKMSEKWPLGYFAIANRPNEES